MSQHLHRNNDPGTLRTNETDLLSTRTCDHKVELDPIGTAVSYTIFGYPKSKPLQEAAVHFLENYCSMIAGSTANFAAGTSIRYTLAPCVRFRFWPQRRKIEP